MRDRPEWRWRVAKHFVPWALVLLSGVAQAQPLFADDVESGTLLPGDTPPGRWDSYVQATLLNTLQPSMLAAHRGSYGIRQVDDRAVTGAGDENHLVWRQASPVMSVGLRFWLRVPVNNLGGSLFVGTLLDAPGGPVPGGGQVATVGLSNAPAGAGLGGFDATGLYQYDRTPAPDASVWHLYEVAVDRIGNPLGTRALYIDGRLSARRAPLDMTGQSFAGVNLGEYYADERTFMGTLDFDDIRVEGLPQASTLTVTATPVGSSPCVPAIIGLVSSDGRPAPAPYDFIATLEATAPAGFHSNADCSAPVTAVSFAAGGTQALAYFAPGVAAQPVLRARFVDFLTTDATYGGTVIPDGGAPDAGAPDAGPPNGAPGRLDYAVGCGCGASSPSEGVVAVLVTMLFSFCATRPSRSTLGQKPMAQVPAMHCEVSALRSTPAA